jgi:hypothetical protein
VLLFPIIALETSQGTSRAVAAFCCKRAARFYECPSDAGCGDGYRFAKCDGKSNSADGRKAPTNMDFYDFHESPLTGRSRSIHRDA